MTVDRSMLADFLAAHPFQPATAFWRAVEVAEVARRSLPLGRGLDLGCGDGKLTDILLRRIGERELVGVDIDPLETKQASAFRFYTQVHTCPAAAIPESAGSFDFAFSNSVLEHIHPIEPVVKEVARLVREGGRFVFTVPSASFHSCLRGPLSSRHPRDQYLVELDQRCAHLYYWDEAQWQSVLKRWGFELKSSSSYLNVAEVRRWETLSRFTGGILFNIFGKKRHPIEIQRALSMRGGTMRLPISITRQMARVMTSRLKADSNLHGCLFMEAIRTAREIG